MEAAALAALEASQRALPKHSWMRSIPSTLVLHRQAINLGPLVLAVEEALIVVLDLASPQLAWVEATPALQAPPALVMVLVTVAAYPTASDQPLHRRFASQLERLCRFIFEVSSMSPRLGGLILTAVDPALPQLLQVLVAEVLLEAPS
jgi:hypothetical protein